MACKNRLWLKKWRLNRHENRQIRRVWVLLRHSECDSLMLQGHPNRQRKGKEEVKRVMIDTADVLRRMDLCKLTCGHVARELGITEREARCVIYGRCVPSWEHLVRLANMLGCKPLQLIKSERRNHNG